METFYSLSALLGQICLETFLVEWKPQHMATAEQLAAGLETFLVEWKPPLLEVRPRHVSSLETFLVEWKPSDTSASWRMRSP